MDALDPNSAEARAYLALSHLFLDLDARGLLGDAVRACRAAGWDAARMRRALLDQLAPVVGSNRWMWFGEDEAFPPDWLLPLVLERSSVDDANPAARFVFRTCVPGLAGMDDALCRLHEVSGRVPPEHAERLLDVARFVAEVAGDASARSAGRVAAEQPRPAWTDPVDLGTLHEAAGALAPVLSCSERRAVRRVQDQLAARAAMHAARGFDLGPFLGPDGPTIPRARLCPELAEALSDEVLGAIARAHAEAGRAYHDLAHLDDLLTLARDEPLRDRPSVELAILVHDLVQTPGRRGAEAASVACARKLLRRSPAARYLPRVEAMVLATAHHDEEFDAAADPDLAFLLDADLSIVGAAPAVFAAYDRAIAAEHAHLAPRLYAHGRRRFARALLARTRLFRTEAFHARAEAAARTNLRTVLATR